MLMIYMQIIIVDFILGFLHYRQNLVCHFWFNLYLIRCCDLSTDKTSLFQHAVKVFKNFIRATGKLRVIFVEKMIYFYLCKISKTKKTCLKTYDWPST